MILLQLVGVVCGLCIVVAAPWGYVQAIRDGGFDASCLLMFPVHLFLMFVGFALIVFSIGGFA